MCGISENRSNCLGIILGFSSVANGFMFHIGAFNLRICDLVFWFLPIYWFVFRIRIRNYYDRNILTGVILVSIFFFWLTISGFIHFEEYNELYKDFFIKYYVNKLIWIPLYAMIFMAYGGERFFYNVLLGISICLAINSIFVLYEYYSILNGQIPSYSFLEMIGLYIDKKKEDVINQNMIRPTGLMLDPNYTGGYAGIGLIFFDYLYKKTKKRKFIFCQLLSMIPMFVLFSRTGLFSLFLCFIFSLLLYAFAPPKFHYRLLSPLMFSLLVIGVVFVGLYIYSFDESTYQLLLDRLVMNDSSAGTRTLYLDAYIEEASISQIFFGVGTSGSGFSLGSEGFFYGAATVWAPESNVITFFMEQGLFFLLLYFILCVLVMSKLLRRNYYYALIFLYINLIGISYNFLGDRVFYFLISCFFLWVYANVPNRIKIEKYNNSYGENFN